MSDRSPRLSWGSGAHHRGATTPLYHLITPENRLPSRLPALPEGASATLLVTPRRRGSRFGQYHLWLPAGGRTRPIEEPLEHCLYVLDGTLELSLGEGSHMLEGRGAFAYVAVGERFALTASTDAELLWIKRPYEPLPSHAAPASRTGHRDRIEPQPDDVPGSWVRVLLSSRDPAFDLSLVLLSFDPGVAFAQVEIHDEDHGLYMTAGEGVYLLGRDRHAVRADDFIYMAPYCPQHFMALGAERAEYLLYKPANRDGFPA